MKTRTKTAIITTLIAVPALFLGPVIFPLADVGVEPTAAQIPFFMFLGLTDAVLLTLGVSFLIGARRATAAYLEKRGLARPRIPWDEIEAVKKASSHPG